MLLLMLMNVTWTNYTFQLSLDKKDIERCNLLYQIWFVEGFDLFLGFLCSSVRIWCLSYSAPWTLRMILQHRRSVLHVVLHRDRVTIPALVTFSINPQKGTVSKTAHDRDPVELLLLQRHLKFSIVGLVTLRFLIGENSTFITWGIITRREEVVYNRYLMHMAKNRGQGTAHWKKFMRPTGP